MNLPESVKRWLHDRRLTRVLLVVHVLMMLAAILRAPVRSTDETTYMALARSLEHGRFSVWDGVFEPPPADVIRTHGYPAFLAAVRLIGHDVRWVFLVQGMLHLTLLLLLLRLLKGDDAGSNLRRNALLLLLLPQLQLLHYAAQVFPETLVSLLLLLVALAAMRGPAAGRWWRLGLAAAALFWVRPVMLLLPLALLLFDLLVSRRGERWMLLRANALALGFFVALGPLPFACWNQAVHGYFKPVPLTGSAVISNLGIWQARLPGYGTMHYFQNNFFGHELVPWVTPDEAERHYARYQQQWQRIDSITRPAMTARDSLLLPQMIQDSIYYTRSARYTVALNEAIAAENRQMIRDEPLYYIATRAYAAVRLWITNVNLPMARIVYRPGTGLRPEVGRPDGLKGWLSVLAPTVITGLSFGIGLPLLCVAIWRNRSRWYERRYLLLVILYVWMVHIPMTIQSRYTVPLHAIALACMAWAIGDRWLRGRHHGETAARA